MRILVHLLGLSTAENGDSILAHLLLATENIQVL